MRSKQHDGSNVSILLYPRFHELAPQNVGWHYREKGCGFGPGTQCMYVFQFVMKGKGDYTVGDQTNFLSENDLFLIRPGEVVSYYADQEDPYMYVWIALCSEDIEAFLQDTGFSDEVYVQNVPEARSLFTTLQTIIMKRDTDEMQICALLYELFHILRLRQKREKGVDKLPVKYVQFACDYIEMNYHQNVSIQSIADEIGINRKYFSKIFKAEKGVTPQQYLTDFRLKQAVILLENPQLTVEEIAHSVGYTNIGNFFKLYKKKYGSSPKGSNIALKN